MIKQFGGKLTKPLIEHYAKSPNWRDGKFQNLEETVMEMSLSKIPGLMYKQIWERDGRSPSKSLPVMPLNVEEFMVPSDNAKLIWYGHSAILLRIQDKTVLIDPMLGPDAAPTAPFKIKRFSEDVLAITDNLPTIDLMLISHDHYDHLDFVSIQKLKGKTQHYLVAQGVARHLISWGIDANKITEMDWWDSKSLENISITFTPSRHFSGRGLSDRFKSLWGGWAIKSENENILFSGDGGYGEHFKEIGKRLGPFDFGFMECGQYNELWHQIHMYPEESVWAALDARVKKMMAVHWGAFSLALHKWKDPIQRFVVEAARKNVESANPPIGQAFKIQDKIDSEWWNAFG